MISVVIPCFNQGHFLIDCLQSLSNSTYRPLEVIIVNDGSTDNNTIDIITNVQSTFPKLNIVIVHQKNSGLSSARNAGIDRSQGKFIQLLDSDDMISPNKLTHQMELFKTNPNKKCIISEYCFITENGKIDSLPTISTIKGYNLDVVDFLTKWEKQLSIPIHCALFEKSVFSNIRFSTDFKAKEDWIFWTLLSFQCGPQGFLYHSDIDAIYRQNSNSMTKKDPSVMLLDWVKAQTYLLVKFGHLLSETELAEVLNVNTKHISETYLKEIKSHNKPDDIRDSTLKSVTIRTLQTYPIIYKFIRNYYRILRRHFKK